MGGPALAEFDLIARIRARATSRQDVLLGIGDDAAILRVPPAHDLVVSTDTLNAGVHFPLDTAAADIGWKALAVNLSDLAAMAAQPAWCTLNLTLPAADADWLDAFLDGFLDLAGRHRVALVGGDTTRGPLSVSVTAHGFAPPDTALRRGGAQAGDEIWVSGTLGDAAAGLVLLRASPTEAGAEVREAPQHPFHGLIQRLHRPEPRVGLGLSLRGIASACIDVSDGLLADLGHIIESGGLGAQVEPSLLPTSPALCAVFDPPCRQRFQLAGGDDYELCFTAAPERAEEVLAAATRAGVTVTRIGRITVEPGLYLRDPAGALTAVEPRGYRHFDPIKAAAARA